MTRRLLICQSHSVPDPYAPNTHLRRCGHLPGELAYVDSFSGLVPVKVVSLEKQGTYHWVNAKVTADHRIYKRGEIVSFGSGSVMPRNHRYTRRGNILSFGCWSWIDPANPCDCIGCASILDTLTKEETPA